MHICYIVVGAEYEQWCTCMYVYMSASVVQYNTVSSRTPQLSETGHSVSE